LIGRLLEAPPDGRAPLEVELLRRATDPDRRATLTRLLLARAQEADEYLGASAESARYYLARLTKLRQT